MIMGGIDCSLVLSKFKVIHVRYILLGKKVSEASQRTKLLVNLVTLKGAIFISRLIYLSLCVFVVGIYPFVVVVVFTCS